MEALLCCDCPVQVTQLMPGRSGISMVKGVQLFHTLQHLTCLMAGDREEARALVLRLEHDPVLLLLLKQTSKQLYRTKSMHHWETRTFHPKQG